MPDFDLSLPFVQTKAQWADEWEGHAYLYCTKLSGTVSPALGTAKFDYQYGDHMKRPGLDAYESYEPLDIGGKLVKVLYEDEDGGARTWLGVITNPRELPSGGSTAGGKVGEQKFTALSIEFLLERSIISWAWMAAVAGPLHGPLFRAPAFNAGAGRDTDTTYRGNKSDGFGEVPQFGGTFEWSLYDVARYLCKHFALPDLNYNATLPITVDPTGLSWLRGIKAPITKQQGRSVKSVLDSLFDHRRLMFWRLDADPETDELKLKVDTFTEAGVSLSGATIPANSNIVNVTAASVYAPRLQGYSVNRDFKPVYDQVRVTGEPVGCVFSLETGGTWEPGWDGATAATRTGAQLKSEVLTWQQNQARKDDQAADEDTALRYFRAPEDWDGTYNGVAAVRDPFLFAGIESAPATFYRNGLELANYLPIQQEGVADAIPTLDGESVSGFAKPFCVVQMISGIDNSYQYGHKIGQPGHDDYFRSLDSNGRRWSIRTRMARRGVGVFLDVVGAEQTAIAGVPSDKTGEDLYDWHQEVSEFFEASLSDEKGNDVTVPAVDWREIITTVYLPGEVPTQAVYPETPEKPLGGVRTLEIKKKGYHLDFLLPETVTSISGGTLNRSTGDTILRDDRAKLMQIAKSAFMWYRRERRAATITIKGPIQANVKPGVMINNFVNADAPAPERLYTVATSVSHSWPRNGDPTHTIQTQHAELDTGML